MDPASFFANVRHRDAPCTYPAGKTTMYEAQRDVVADQLGSYVHWRYGPNATGTQISDAYEELLRSYTANPSLMRSAIQRNQLYRSVLNDMRALCRHAASKPL